MRDKTMKKTINYPVLTPRLIGIVLISVASVCLSVPAYAAKSWGVSNEVKAKFVGTVVDITCELTGNCPDNCGQSSRQLGLKTVDQGVILFAKNLTLYSGAADELVGFCGQEIEVDGLFTEHKNVRFFQLQKMRASGGKWTKATRFHKAWAEKNDSTARKAKRWYRQDERVKAIIARDGYLGLGLDKDAEFFKK